MENLITANKNEIFGKLRLKGLTLKDFAQEREWDPNTVQQIVRRYAGTNKIPRGELTKKVLIELTNYLKD